jgi:hypothetical protein
VLNSAPQRLENTLYIPLALFWVTSQKASTESLSCILLLTFSFVSSNTL